MRLFSMASVLTISFFLVLSLVHTGTGQTTAFTYQGNLQFTGQPANGNYDFQFALYDAATAGAQLGPTQTLSSVAVSNGAFTVTLDFGSQFPGANRFLEIRVRQSGPGSYTVLAARQPVLSTPYAIRSTIAGTAENAQSLGGLVPSAFIRNSTSQQPTSDFNISGNGTAGGTFSANIVNAAVQFSLLGNRVLHVPGTRNTFVGIGAGVTNPNFASTDHTFFGFESGTLQAVSGPNSFFGSRAGTSNTTGGENAFFGFEAGRENVDGDQNSFFGAYSGRLNTTGNGNSFFGTNSGAVNTTGNDNSFFGSGSGSSSQTGTQNSMFGRRAGFLNVAGTDNAYFGFEAGRQTTTSFNSFFGSQAGRNTTSGTSNSFFGASAGFANLTGADNSFFGVNTGVANTAGSGNTYFGRRAGRDGTTGDNNTAIGIDAGRDNLTGSNNTFIGAGADASASNLSFATALGAGVTVGSSNTVVIGRGTDAVRLPGDTVVTNLYFKVFGTNDNTVCTSNSPIYSGFSYFVICGSSIRFKERVSDYKSGIDVIKRLRPVRFHWRSDGTESIGLIAEEVNQVEPSLNTFDDEGNVLGIKYNGISALLLNAVNEQQSQIEKLQETVREQQTQIAARKTEIAAQRFEIDILKQYICQRDANAPFCKEKK